MLSAFTMSGHSKWATIKRQKGANDAKRGQQFTKLANAIAIAVRQGGGVADPDDNPRLRLAVDAARSANMPKENIERAIQRSVGKQADSVDEAVYEGFGPGGFSIIVETVTDNKQRTVSEIQSFFKKNGGSIGTPGSVAYQFTQKGAITVVKNDKSLDDIYLLAADSGAEDVEDAQEVVIIYTEPTSLAKVRDSLKSEGLSIEGAELIRKPIVSNTISEKAAAEKALDFIEKLEEMDDVQKIYANFDIPDHLLVA
jgi:YebC/PmpR family DNA-binding regulatory protein